MSQQTIRQQARRTAREMAAKRRRERAKRERRLIDLAEQVMVALGERDAAVTETEKRAGIALRELTHVEGLSLSEAITWCGQTMTAREAARLRRLADDQDSGTDAAHVDGTNATGAPAATAHTGSAGAGAVVGGAGAGAEAGTED
jgi:hypothetical protein